MSRYIKIFVGGLLFFSLGSGLFAQQDSVSIDSPDLPSEEVEVIKDFKARLAETNRIKIIAELPIVSQSELPFLYEVNTRGLALDYPAPLIRPVALPQESKPSLYNTYVKLGYGYPRFSTLQINSAYDLTDRITAGILVDHMAARHNERIPDRFAYNKAKVNLTYEINDLALASLDLYVDRNSHRLVTIADSLGAVRRANVTGATINLQMPKMQDRAFDYNLNFDIKSFGLEDLGYRENTLNLDLAFAKSWGAITTGLSLHTDRSSGIIDNIQAFSSFNLRPYVSYNTDLWNIDAAGIVLFENQSNFILPDVAISREILGSKLHVSAFAKTDLSLNNYTNTADFNPFIAVIDTISNLKEMSFGLGAQGSFDKLEYHAELGYQVHNDLLAFNVDSLAESQHRLWNAERIDARTIFLKARIEYAINDMMSVDGYVKYQNLRDSSGMDILGYYDWEFGARYKLSLLDQKLLIKPGFDLYANLATESEEQATSFFDLQLDASYQFNDRFGLFLNVDNITNSRNARWTNYNAIGFAINGGFQLKF